MRGAHMFLSGDTDGRNNHKSVQSSRMSLITRRPRFVRDEARRLLAFTATYAGGVLILELATGRHYGLAALTVSGAGTLSGITAVRIGQAAISGPRKSRDTPTDHQREPDYPLVPGFPPEVVILVDQGRKIRAIGRYRELNPGIGLKAAKDAIDELAASRGQLLP
jgi:ribosomal protein L7/L12